MNEEEKQPQVLSEKRKSALLRYMAILFAVAFALVLLSLILQMNSSKATLSELNEVTSSALSNAEQLQEQNRALQDEKQTLLQQNDSLQKELQAQQKDLDGLLEAADEAAEKDQKTIEEKQQQLVQVQRDLLRTQEAYEALLVAKSCTVREGNLTYAKAMEALKTLKSYLGETGLAEYEQLLEE